MFKNSAQLVPAVPLIEGKINKGVGTYTAICLIHCETDAAIELSDGTVYNMIAGDDRGYEGEFTVVSGTVTYD